MISRTRRHIKFSIYVVALCFSIYTFIKFNIENDSTYLSSDKSRNEKNLMNNNRIYRVDISHKREKYFEIVNDTKSNKIVNRENATNNEKNANKFVFDTSVTDNPKLVNKFLTLRGKNVTSYNHRFLITSKNTCSKEEAPFLVILCLTKHENTYQREAIRETWGSIAINKTWPLDKKIYSDIKLVFVFGRHYGNNLTKQALLEKESKLHGDIVQADFRDSYFNLTIKVLTGLKWVNMFCPRTQFVLKADDDTFINVKTLFGYLKSVVVPEKGVVIGHALSKPMVVRFGKWKISERMYPFYYYPVYTSGNTYVISGNLMSKLLFAAERMPYISIEDAFITGILRMSVGAYVIDKEGFTHGNDRPPRICSFHNEVRISATKVTPVISRDLWILLNVTLDNCYTPPKPRTSFVNDTEYLKWAKVLNQNISNYSFSNIATE